MAEKNVLEKITFVNLYDATLNVAALTRDKPGTLPGVSRQTTTVQARYQAAYCAEQMLLLVTKSASNNEMWPLKWLPQRTIVTIGGLDVTAAVNAIYEGARRWRNVVLGVVKDNRGDYDVDYAVGAPPMWDADGADTLVAEMSDVIDKINADTVIP